MINDEIQQVGKAKAKSELDRRIRTIWKKGALSPVFFPAEPSDVEDAFERPRLVVLHYDAVGVSAASTPPPPQVELLYERVGTAHGFRTYRNHLVFLVADDEAAVDHAVEEARRHLAIRRIVGDAQRFSQYSKDQQQRLKSREQAARLNVRVAITRLYRHLYYPDASAGNHRLSHYPLPAQDQGNVDKDQTRVALRALRELGKVRTADDRAPPPAYLRQKAWPANAQRITSRQLQKEFASRVGLPILLDINLLSEAIKLGIKSQQWLYFDPAQQCAYSKESPTSPLVRLHDQIELILPEAAEGVPICGQPEDPATGDVTGAAKGASCPVCRHPQDACACAGAMASQQGSLEGEGLPSQAFQRVADLAQDQQINGLSGLEVRVGGTDREFVRDLEAMALAIPQLPKASVRLKVNGTFELPDDDQIRIEFDGSWKRYRQINQALLRVAKDANASSGRIVVRVSFPRTVQVSGSEMRSIRDTFTNISPGHVSVVALPGEKSP